MGNHADKGFFTGRSNTEGYQPRETLVNPIPPKGGSGVPNKSRKNFITEKVDKNVSPIGTEIVTEGYEPSCKYCGSKLAKALFLFKLKHGGCINKDCKNYWENRIPHEGYNPPPLDKLERPKPSPGQIITEGIRPKPAPGRILDERLKIPNIPNIPTMPKPKRPTGELITEGFSKQVNFPKISFIPTYDIKFGNFSLGIIVGIIVTLLLKGF